MEWLKGSLEFITNGKGLLEITAEIEKQLRAWQVNEGMCFIYLPHASASLTISESYDPSARLDVEAYYDHAVPENESWYHHTLEGPDDSPSHIRATLTQPSLTIPVENSQLALGTWQGVFLFEHRARQHRRRVVLRCLKVN